MAMRSFHRSSCYAIIPILITCIISLLLLFYLLPNGIPKSYGHAFTIRSDPSPSQSSPTPPSKVQVFFSEPIDLRYSTIKVLDSSGHEVDNKDKQAVAG